MVRGVSEIGVGLISGDVKRRSEKVLVDGEISGGVGHGDRDGDGDNVLGV